MSKKDKKKDKKKHGQHGSRQQGREGRSRSAQSRAASASQAAEAGRYPRSADQPECQPGVAGAPAERQLKCSGELGAGNPRASPGHAQVVAHRSEEPRRAAGLGNNFHHGDTEGTEKCCARVKGKSKKPTNRGFRGESGYFSSQEQKAKATTDLHGSSRIRPRQEDKGNRGLRG